MAEHITTYPMRLSIDYPGRALSRLTTFFRIFTIIPIAIILILVTSAGQQGGGGNGCSYWL
ncbi:hypothetical protein ACFLVX_04770 [Chloroflexota bacterium]